MAGKKAVKKKTASGKKKKASAAVKPGAAPKPTAYEGTTQRHSRPTVSTQFVTDFIAEFIGYPGAWKWPARQQSKESVAEDYKTIQDALMDAGYLLIPPEPGETDSLFDRVENFIIQEKWPKDSPVQKEYENCKRTIHLVEISQITDHLLEAINAQGTIADGSGNGWPPH